ncbi:ribose-phosphate pyrophosphokinase, partial [Lecanoromycetidae sp. Uapishka_2]
MRRAKIFSGSSHPLLVEAICERLGTSPDNVDLKEHSNGETSVAIETSIHALKLNFALVTTERRRPSPNGNGNGSVENSVLLDSTLDRMGVSSNGLNDGLDGANSSPPNGTGPEESSRYSHQNSSRSATQPNGTTLPSLAFRSLPNNREHNSSPLVQSTRLDSASPPTSRIPIPRDLVTSGPARALNLEQDEDGEDSTEEYTDERAREVITGRLVHGHIVDDDAPSPVLSTMSNSIATLPGEIMGQPQIEDRDPMTSSFISTTSFQNVPDNALGGSIHDATAHSDDEEGYQNPQLEHTVTLVGNVRDRTVLIVDDLIDHCGSWIAAAETVVMRGNAKTVYCIATHGLFGNDSLEQMEACDCIDFIVVTNTYPIDPERLKKCKKLIILDISHLLSEAIRRNHYGESISSLFQHYPD